MTQAVRAAFPAWTQEPSRVAIVHDWLTGMRGGEAILDVLCELFPNADLYALLQTDHSMSPNILNGRKLHHSYLQRFLFSEKMERSYRRFLPLFPHAISQFDLSGYDLVLSNSSCVAKGVTVGEQTIHVAYIHTPMRYMWDLFDDYFGSGRADPLTRVMARGIRGSMRAWDVRSTQSVDYLIANSNFVQDRIKRFWNRESEVIYPFVDLDRFSMADETEEPEDFYLVVSAFAPYKRIDLAVEAFRRLKLPLKIVGSGPEANRWKSKSSDNITFLGQRTSAEISDLYRKSKALIFPGLEDFGITPLEAMSSGRPVIGFGKGGLLDTVTEETGILFTEQTPEALMAAVEQLEQRPTNFSSQVCRNRAEVFSRDIFVRRYGEFLQQCLQKGNV